MIGHKKKNERIAGVALETGEVGKEL